ncbi:MAG: tRNA pseudouridine(38-40) synthase TruA [Anaerolineales bacterium]
MAGTMARYQVILAYDGAAFAGSQRQTSTARSPVAKKRTVQGELEDALRKLGWNGRSALLAGRTDSGVHATGQVAAFDLDWPHADEDLLRALNANLPADLAVRAVRIAPPTFHPRFDALSRRYYYRLFCQPVRHPLREKTAWRVWPEVDGEALQATAALFIGRHDFAAYGSPPRAVGSTVRTVMQSAWKRLEDEWQYEVQADAFLYRMVRRLVFVQAAVAQGKIPAEAVARSLAGQAEARERGALPAGLAPAHGLILVEVCYPQ